LKKWILALVVVFVLLSGSVCSFAAADSAVTIASPAETTYGDNLLISIKLTAPKTIKVSAYEEQQKSGEKYVSIDPSKTDLSKLSAKDIQSVSIMTAEEFTGTGTLSVYSKRIEDVHPGVYRIKVETLNAAKEVTATTSTRIVVMEQDDSVASGSEIFQTPQSSVKQWVQNFLKNLFGN